MSDPDVDTALDDALILVVGARRSGTHWLQRILSTHPDVTALPGETHLFSAAIRPLMERFHHGTPTSPTSGHLYVEEPQLLAAMRQFCDEVLLPHVERSGTSRLLERTPEHVHHIDLISNLYPSARIVHIIRDGRDSVRSLLHQDFGPNNVRAAALEWRDSVTAGREQGAHAQHYREIRYEALAAETASEVAGLLAWLGLDAESEVIASAVAESHVVQNRARGRPRKTRKVPRILREVAGDLLQELGYVGEVPSPADTDVRRESAAETADPVVGRPLPDTPRRRQYAFDQFLSELRSSTPRVAVLQRLAAPSARFEIIDADGSVRRPAGIEELVAGLADDASLRAAPSRARLNIGADMTVLVHKMEDGAVRVITAKFNDTGIGAFVVDRVA